MKNDLQSGTNVKENSLSKEENPLAKVLEIQQKRVLEVLEMAVLQTINDIRGTFDDLSDTDELFFEAKLHEEVLRVTRSRHMNLVKGLSDLGDGERAELAVRSLANILN